MKKLFLSLNVIFAIFSMPVSLAASNVSGTCYYLEPNEPSVDENFFQELIRKSYNREETFSGIEDYLSCNIPFSHRFQFKYPLKDRAQADVFAKVMQIKAQEAHRFVPVIAVSDFIARSRLGFLRQIYIADNGPIVLENVLLDGNSRKIIFIEEWVLDSSGVTHPGGFAAINSIIEEDGQWYFAGTYLYKYAPKESGISDSVEMFQKTYENMISFIDNDDVEQVYKQLHEIGPVNAKWTPKSNFSSFLFDVFFRSQRI